MKSFIFLFLLSLIIFSCANENNTNDKGIVDQSCDTNNPCQDGLLCIQNICKTNEDACKFITCSGDDGLSHGKCVIEGSSPICQCNTGYERTTLFKCEKIPDPEQTCENIECTGDDGKSHGTCIIRNDIAVCQCDLGYKLENNNLNCIAENPEQNCKEDTCVGKYGSECTEMAGVAECVCKDGYEENLDGDCLPVTAYFCNESGIDCGLNKHMTGYCEILIEENEQGEEIIKPYCPCEEGWLGEECNDVIEIDCSICNNDLNSTGECRVDQQDEEQKVICICNEGYTYDFELGCIIESSEKGNIQESRIFKGTLNNACFLGNACQSGLVCENNLCVKADEFINQTIIITTEEANKDLVSIQKGVVTFNKNTRTSLFKKNQILAFQHNDLIKDSGFIGKINSISYKGSKVIINTEPISPFEILGNSVYEIKDNIIFDQPIDPTVSTTNKSVTKSIAYDKTFYSDTFKIKGTLNVKYDFSMKLDLRRYTNSLNTYELNSFDLTNNVELSNNLDLTLQATSFTNEKMKIPYQGSDILRKEKISTFTIYLPYNIQTKGEFYLSVRALFSAYIEGYASIKMETKSKTTSGLKYINKKTTRSANYTLEKQNLESKINFDGSGSLTFQVVPSIKFSAYSSNIRNNIEISTEVYDSPVIFSSILDKVTSKSCYNLEGLLSSNLYVSLDLMNLYKNGSAYTNGVSMTWNKEQSPSDKKINWLGQSNKCEVFSCTEDSQCRINQSTISSTCDSGSCSTSNSSVNYEFIDIPGADFIRGCVGSGVEE